MPLTFISGLGLASENGILIKGSQYFENLNQAQVLLTDKTGTLTTGKFKVEDVKYFGDYDKEEILDYIYNIELLSTHPIAKGVVESLNREEKPDFLKMSQMKKALGSKPSTKMTKKSKLVQQDM